MNRKGDPNGQSPRRCLLVRLITEPGTVTAWQRRGFWKGPDMTTGTPVRIYKRITKIIGLDQGISKRRFECVGFANGKLVHFKSNSKNAAVCKITLRDSILKVAVLQSKWEGSGNGIDCDVDSGSHEKWLRQIAAVMPR
jgi:hypothetical protein